jgi:hypothetical protein
MSFLNSYLNNLAQGLTNPKGTLGDYAHANYIFVNGQYRLAPRTKYLYVCFLELSNDARNFAKAFGADPSLVEEAGILVKNVDLPKITMEVSTKNQYNRKKNVQTHLSYDPVSLTFHDDNYGLTTALMEAYYRYYFVDGNYTTPGAVAQYDPRNMYKGENHHRFRYGLDNESGDPFFTKIKVYQMARQDWTSFTLVNPLVTSYQHDTMDHSDATTPSQNQMTIAYESVFYDRGSVVDDPPPGIGGPNYDNRPSPLTAGGGGTRSLLGPGGVAQGLSGIFDDIAEGRVGGRTVIETFNTFQNARQLTREGLRQEGVNILANIPAAAITNTASGIANTVFPKNTGRGSVTASGIQNTGRGSVTASGIQNIGRGSVTASGIQSDRVNPIEEISPAAPIFTPGLEGNQAAGGRVNVTDPIYEDRIRTAEANNTREGTGG